jgi:hypothetical protein
MGMNERVESKKDRVEATERYILGLLFEVEAELAQKQNVAHGIAYDIFGSIEWDRDNFQKIALGHLVQFSGKLPNDQLIAISRKIARFA